LKVRIGCKAARLGCLAVFFETMSYTMLFREVRWYLVNATIPSTH